MKPIPMCLCVWPLSVYLVLLMTNGCASVDQPRKVTIRTSFNREPDTTRSYYNQGQKQKKSTNSGTNYSGGYDDSADQVYPLDPTSEDGSDPNEDYYNSEKAPVKTRYQETQPHTNAHQAEPVHHQKCYSAGDAPRCRSELKHLEHCVNCEMAIAEHEKYIRCEQYFNAAIRNSTYSAAAGEPDHLFQDPGTLICCQLSRLMKCVVPIVFRACNQHCALQQFVKKYRPHLELCHLITNTQCPIQEGAFLEELRLH